ncbi:M50 family metallopeptidase, partial [Escherichia coli]|nr:M50 family metallopeptidase [Escherichia coli]
RAAMFLVSLLAAQCVMNALLDLKTVLFLSAPFAPHVPTDAANMAEATGIPAAFWSVVWIALALLILYYALRSYAE